jgi:adenylate kinase
VRLFSTIIDGIDEVHGRLLQTDWGDRGQLELALWRDEETFITGLLADLYRKPHYVIARSEPPDNLAQLVLSPWKPKAYLSFPITAFKGKPDEAEVNKQIGDFRDQIRRWLVVFDPFAIKDYDLTYQVPAMKEISKELGEQTEQRDFRFIDQSEILIAFFPQAVPSKGVEAELRHAKTTGKIIYLYYPGGPGAGPFSVVPDYAASSPEEFLELIRQHFEDLDKRED